ncbi:MAG: DNA alkylation repair protein [Bacteroides sp.]|nr:DNA alkylation repair protein [Bacteroides sp.]
MDNKALINDIIETLEEMSTPKRKEMSAHSFPTSMRVIGVTSPQMRELIKAVKGRHEDWNETQWISLCKALVLEVVFECQVIAYEIISKDKKLLGALSYEDLMDLWQNLDNWASVDHFTVGIYGVLWGKGVVKDHHIEGLLLSDNFWDRRVAVVSTVALNLKSRGGKGDTPRTLAVCERVVDERLSMIWKALSWALRELSKRDPDAVWDFLEKYELRMSKQAVREITHKLEFGTKN